MNPLGPVQRRLLHATLAVLVASGAGWALIEYAGVPPYLGKPFLLKVHGAAAMAALVLVGSLLTRHVRGGWVSRRNRASGAATLGLGALLTLTGYLLYYAGDERVRDVSSYVHLALGLALPIALGVHLLKKGGAHSQSPNDTPHTGDALSSPGPISGGG